MTTTYVGTTNTDGTGSASGLNAGNAALSLIGTGSVSADGVSLESTGGILSATVLSSDTWNKAGYKEAKVDGNDNLVYVNNFVDVDIDNNNSQGASILVANAKRGTIDTGNGNDAITIAAFSNSLNWGNLFEVNSGFGNDIITITHAKNSQFTRFEIDAGAGNDVVDVSGLLGPAVGAEHRFADGGSGFDVLKLSGTDTVSFENFEVVRGAGKIAPAALTIDSALLAANNAEAEVGFGLVLSNIDITLDGSILGHDSYELTADEAMYLDAQGLDAEDFYSVTVYTEEGAYQILTSDSDYAPAV
ncbi:rhizobiocin [Vibrio nigripulchritudo ATCC 27043]|uniref:hypothetical protein n=1 Tax=Vibrio nigripulchritudo TaxID=28173 RepID=UPI00021C2E0C|nr:hypothetical protein [Vibrio nigripulchritudo]EGU56194.1 rhizobiocin [Vibrio nigripulchritudo ATCC 27043]BCL73132.1 hypothetical protein VNTUMSATTG_50690 [Vibrio nigripulchritudo]BDU34495.1 hypothetical protein TUMSATVNIG1_51040 [Vibrio nigripulchritudo]